VYISISPVWYTCFLNVFFEILHTLELLLFAYYSYNSIAVKTIQQHSNHSAYSQKLLFTKFKYYTFLRLNIVVPYISSNVPL